MAELHTCYLGVGTNLGDRVQNVIDARRRLESDHRCHSVHCSSMYWTSPLGYLNQPAFINCVFKVSTSASPEDFHILTQSIENQAGRRRDPSNQNAPRIIDIDILLFGDVHMESENLVIPHPRMLSRRFVLEPLLELEPSIEIKGKPVRQHYLDGLEAVLFLDQDVFKLGS